MYFLKNRQNDAWLDVIEKEMEKLKAGDGTGLRIVYYAFATGDRKFIGRAACAIRRYLEHFSLEQMIHLHERFRSFTSLEWYIDWTRLPLDKILKALEREDRKYVLILGTFHPNGYFREQCMTALAEEKGTLPYLMLRANDWVLPVRNKAFELLSVYLEQCSLEEILSSMPVLEKLKGSLRRSDGQMEELKDQVFVRLEQILKSANWSRVWPEDFSVRKSLYRTAIEMRKLSLEQMMCWLQREKSSCGRMILINGILAHPDCTLHQAEIYLQYPNTQVRRKALEYKYEHLKTGWPGLESMLLDSGRGVREYAVYILERHTDLDIRGYYLEHLKDDKPEYAILGLSEYSHRENVPMLLSGLQSPVERIRKYTLLALGRQEDFEDEELLWNYLWDKKPGISKAAYISILKKDFYLGAEKIYHAYCGAREEHIRRYLLRLLLRESSWSRLPWLIRLYSETLPEQEKKLIRAGIDGRFMYGKVPEVLKEEVVRALGENGGALPEKMETGIRYDMKFV